MGNRARGANARLAHYFNSGAYGAVPGSVNYALLPFVTSNLGDEQGLVDSDLLGFGRADLPQALDVINNDGDVVVPVDLRNFGIWLKMLFGAPTTTAGIAATGSLTFSNQPANNAIITINGTAFTFTTGTPTAAQIKIGATLAETVANAVIALNQSADVNVKVASYQAAQASGIGTAFTVIQVTHDTPGTAGNSFTLAAGTSPATNATVSGATLAGGAASGAQNHLFSSGGLNLPDAAIEVQKPDVPSYGMNYGCVAGSLSIPFQRSGNLSATINLTAQGETVSASSGAGTPTQLTIERFSQFSAAIRRDGVPLADVVSGTFSFSNGLDKVETIRPDGRIGGVDAGKETAGLQFITRFQDNTLFDLATSGTPVEIALEWRISATKRLQLVLLNVLLPKPKLPVTGPGGIQATFDAKASLHPVAQKMVQALLINDVAAY